jgi:hypothetical protein
MRAQAYGDGIICASLEEGLLDHHARGQYADHFPPDEPAGLGGVLDLVAEGDTQAGLQQPANVTLIRVVRHAGERKTLPFPQFPRGEGDAENRRDALGVLSEGLVKVAEPEKDDGVGMLPLDPEVLVEDRTRLQRSPS